MGLKQVTKSCESDVINLKASEESFDCTFCGVMERRALEYCSNLIVSLRNFDPKYNMWHSTCTNEVFKQYKYCFIWFLKACQEEVS